MAHRVGFAWLPLLLAAGCLPGPTNTALVPTSPFPNGKMPRMPATLTASNELEQEGRRVGLLGQKILNANPHLPVKPRFELIGGPSPEVFHRGMDEVVITEGLLQKCKTDGLLAAVLCVELGKMVGEREAAKQFLPHEADPEPPADVEVGNDHHGAFTPDDGTRLQELARWEEKCQRRRAQLNPTPEVLARGYLQKAGYGAPDLAEAAPLLRAARENVTIESQLNGQPLSQPLP
jgi:hypothetical protein